MKALYLFVAAAVFFLAGLTVSTQKLARSLAYLRQLGPPAVRIGEQRIYNPFKFPGWYLHYRARHFDKAALFTCLGLFLGTASLLARARLCRRKTAQSSHGTVTWASSDDIKRRGFFKAGIVLGVSGDNKYLCPDGPEHAMVLAPS
jgi:type IV secretory pathway TraG/TraD family ATPase VirD4